MTSKAATLLFEGFHSYKSNFDSITKNARIRFENQQWKELQKEVASRLYLHKNFVHATVSLVKEWAKDNVLTYEAWHEILKEYYCLVSQRKDIELAFTFFSSVTRKVLPAFFQQESLAYTDFKKEVSVDEICNIYRSDSLLADITNLLREIPLYLPYPLIHEDALLIYKRFSQILNLKGVKQYEKIVTSKSLFFRNRTAYIAGELVLGGEVSIPFLIAMVNQSLTIQAEALISTREELQIIFSFTRAYFLIDTPSPSSTVDFLKRLMPLKRRFELYNSMGFNKHGKTLLFQELHQFIYNNEEKLVDAPGIKGMVMSVFTFPSFHTVFKIIKDEFDPVKTVTRKDVLEKYRLVYKHDRYGRLADTHEFEDLALDLNYFSTSLLQELEQVASKTVKIIGKKVLIRHVFTERKMRPLNLFIEEHPFEIVSQVIIDYGYALKELAYANIFPGDLLLKNFGVTRSLRVVFYDYDEITFVTSCNFKKIPVPQSIEELYAAQPRYEVKENDIFPEEFKRYLVPEGALRDIFIKAHPELFEVSFWEDIKQNHLKGLPYQIHSYSKENCLRKNDS